MSANSPDLCVTVIQAISEVEQTDASELDFSLYEFIEPEVLERLAARHDAEWRLEFSVAAHDVVVESAGTVTVDGREFRWTDQ